jgi:hypothetical protein
MRKRRVEGNKDFPGLQCGKYCDDRRRIMLQEKGNIVIIDGLLPYSPGYYIG